MKKKISKRKLLQMLKEMQEQAERKRRIAESLNWEIANSRRWLFS